MKLSYFGLTDVGRLRAENQDAIYLPAGRDRHEPWLFLLADGMGGANGGQVASSIAAQVAPESFRRCYPTQAPEEALSQAVKEASAAIFRTAVQRPELKGMGTTVVTVALVGGMVWVASVGDSRCYLWRDGGLIQITQDHSLVRQMVRDGALDPARARRHGLRNVLLRVVGLAEDLEVDLFELTLAEYDCLLLCSDGLHGPIEDQDIAALLAKPGSMEEKARQLVDEANQRGGPDNISVILVEAQGLGECHPSGPPVPDA
jgi:protein phosphatase